MPMVYRWRPSARSNILTLLFGVLFSTAFVPLLSALGGFSGELQLVFVFFTGSTLFGFLFLLYALLLSKLIGLTLSFHRTLERGGRDLQLGNTLAMWKVLDKRSGARTVIS